MLYILTYSVPEYFFNQYVLEYNDIGELDEKSFDTLIDDYYVESVTGSYLKITRGAFADWLGK